MPNRALVLVAAAVLEAWEKPSTYKSRRPGHHHIVRRQEPRRSGDALDQVHAQKSFEV
jgi:hypothetical protein